MRHLCCSSSSPPLAGPGLYGLTFMSLSSRKHLRVKTPKPLAPGYLSFHRVATWYQPIRLFSTFSRPLEADNAVVRRASEVNVCHSPGAHGRALHHTLPFFFSCRTR